MLQCRKDMSSPTIAYSCADTQGTPTFHSHLKMSLPQGTEKWRISFSCNFPFVPDLDWRSLYTRVVGLYWMEVEFFVEK